MTLKLIMNANGALDHDLTSLITDGIFVITQTLSPSSKAEGAPVYTETFRYTFSGGNSAGFDPGSIATTAPQVLLATAIKTKANGQLVIREGDTHLMQAVGTVGGTPTPITGLVIISDAGQTTVRAQ